MHRVSFNSIGKIPKSRRPSSPSGERPGGSPKSYQPSSWLVWRCDCRGRRLHILRSPALPLPPPGLLCVPRAILLLLLPRGHTAPRRNGSPTASLIPDTGAAHFTRPASRGTPFRFPLCSPQPDVVPPTSRFQEPLVAAGVSRYPTRPRTNADLISPTVVQRPFPARCRPSTARRRPSLSPASSGSRHGTAAPSSHTTPTGTPASCPVLVLLLSFRPQAPQPGPSRLGSYHRRRRSVALPRCHDGRRRNPQVQVFNR